MRNVTFGPGPDGDYGARRREQERLKRLRWDTYFRGVANAVADNSQCHSRKIGAVLTRDKAIISSGYNGPAAGIPVCHRRCIDDKMITSKMTAMNIPYPTEPICPRYMFGFISGEGLEFCVAGHAERNALIQAAKNGIHTLGSVMYMTCPIPCKDCLTEIINAGVSEIVVTSKEYYDEASKWIVKNSSLSIREYERG